MGIAFNVVIHLLIIKHVHSYIVVFFFVISKDFARTVDQCYGEPMPVVCNPGDMVQVTEAHYRQTPECRGGFHSNFCTREESSNPACVGNQTCIFNTPWIYLSQECGYSNNFLISYKCIPSMYSFFR